MAQGTTRGVPIDTDPLLAADSDLLVASQKATKAYADTKQTALNFTPENVANKQTALSANVAHYYNAPYINTLIESCNRAIVADYTDVVFTASQTAERIIRVIAIPRGTLIVGRDYKPRALVTKVGTGSNVSLRLRLATTATPPNILAVPALAAQVGGAASNNWYPFMRDFIHIQSNSAINYSGANAINDLAVTGNGASASGFNFANVDYWLILTAEHNVISADTITSHGLILLI
jgi:hypothetical protein